MDNISSDRDTKINLESNPANTEYLKYLDNEFKYYKAMIHKPGDLISGSDCVNAFGKKKMDKIDKNIGDMLETVAKGLEDVNNLMKILTKIKQEISEDEWTEVDSEEAFRAFKDNKTVKRIVVDNSGNREATEYKLESLKKILLEKTNIVSGKMKYYIKKEGSDEE